MSDASQPRADPLDAVKTIALYGVGLVNGSLGLALRKRGFAGHIVGLGRREATLAAAADLGAIDSYAVEPRARVGEADLIVMGTPVDVTVEAIASLAEYSRADAVFSDVGSVKAKIVAECAARLPAIRFVGAHPIAGSEQSGVAHARADLYAGSRCIVTTGPQADDAATCVVRALWESVGAEVHTTSPDAHDALLAASSHLPHVVATALTHVVYGSANGGQKACEYGGGGLRDTTRVALGAPEVWTPIAMANAGALASLAEGVAGELQELARNLRQGDRDTVNAWLDRGRALRSEGVDDI